MIILLACIGILSCVGFVVSALTKPCKIAAKAPKSEYGDTRANP